MFPEILKEMHQCGEKLLAKKLVIGPGGNLSCRHQGIMYISPSGLAFDEVELGDYVRVDIESGDFLDDLRPSSEVLMHLACYRRRPEIRCVVHTHPCLATAVVNAGEKIPPMYPDYVAFIGELPVMEYMTPTTAEMGNRVGEFIADHDALMLINHGAVTVGTNVKQAYLRTELIEESARMYLASRSLTEHPRVFSEQEISEIMNLDAEKYRVDLLDA